MAKTQDPTREQLLQVCRAYPYADELDDFDIESAIYWFAND